MAPDWIDVSYTLYCLYMLARFVFSFSSTQYKATMPFLSFPLHFRRSIHAFGCRWPQNLNIKNAFVYDGQIKCNNFFLFNRLCVRAEQRETAKLENSTGDSISIVIYCTFIYVERINIAHARYHFSLVCPFVNSLLYIFVLSFCLVLLSFRFLFISILGWFRFSHIRSRFAFWFIRSREFNVFR